MCFQLTNVILVPATLAALSRPSSRGQAFKGKVFLETSKSDIYRQHDCQTAADQECLEPEIISKVSDQHLRSFFQHPRNAESRAFGVFSSRASRIAIEASQNAPLALCLRCQNGRNPYFRSATNSSNRLRTPPLTLEIITGRHESRQKNAAHEFGE
jgi:hypothetical protein